MVILITGASHTGKTALEQRLLERYHCPYLSIDHLKMGLIRSGCTLETVLEDNRRFLEATEKYGLDRIEIDDRYRVDIEL